MNTQRKTIEAALVPSLTDDEGFATHAVTADLARRQLHVSLAVMGLMLAAALAVVAAVGFPAATAGEPVVAKLTVQQPQFVRPMTAEAPHAPLQPGG